MVVRKAVLKNSNFNTHARMTLFCAMVLFFLSGCQKSQAPSITELVVTRPPTFGGLADHSYTTVTASFTTNGECDPIAYGLQTSTDNVNWTDYAGGCPASGTFSVTIVVASKHHDIWAREKTKNGFTSEGHAYVRLLLPPTSPAFSVAQAAAADDDGYGMQAVMGININNNPVQGSILNNLYNDVVEIVYGK